MGVKSGDADAEGDEQVQEGSTENGEEGAEELDDKQKEILASEKKLKELFNNRKVFYLGRETPKEILTILIRACGGKISDNVEDPKITHQICDRGAHTDMKYAAQRSYLQPQWVFDSVNARFLLPLERFLPNSELPAHLSPFVEEKEDGYRPPERVELEAMARGEDPGLIYGKTVPIQENSSADVQEDDLAPDEESDFDSDDGEDSEDEAEEKRLAKQAMPKKIKRLHDKIEYGQRKERRENETLAKKRKMHDEKKEAKPKAVKASQ